MRDFLKNLSSKREQVFVLAGVAGCISVVLAFSFANPYRIGNIFFGKFPPLYNVQIAQFFFSHATDPLLGNVPPYANYQLSRTHFIQGELRESLVYAYRELELYPEHIRTYYILGLTYGYMNEEEKAIDAFGKFLEYKPESWAARNDKAWLHFRIGDIEGALTTILPATISDPNNPWVLNTYGVLLMNTGRLEESKIAFSNAQIISKKMTEEDWGTAYPGNDPEIYAVGLNSMITAIEDNLKLLEAK